MYGNAGAVTNYTLGQSDAKGAFLPRCQFSGDQQTGTLLDANHILNVFYNGEDFDTPAVPAPAAGICRGRGRGGPAVAAVPAIPGPQDLLFLTHLPLRALEVGGELPLLSYSLLSFHLGPIATRAARLPLAAPARLTAGLLQGAIVQSVGAAAANPTMIAFQIPRLLEGSSLPVTFQSAASDPHTRLKDLMDMLRCSPAVRMRSGASRRRLRPLPSQQLAA